VVKKVKRASIIDTDFNLEEGPSTAYDVEPTANFNKEDALYEVGRGIFKLKRLLFDHLLKLEPVFLLVIDVHYFV
jgi:hypothetical protein